MSVRDSIIVKEVTIYRDTIITVRIPGDTIELAQDIDSILEPLIAENKYAKAIAEVYKNKLRVTLIQKETEINFKLDSAFKQTEYWKERWLTNKQVVIKEVKYTSFLNKVFTPVGIMLVIFILVYIILKTLKK